MSPAVTRPAVPAAFLDRDGTIIEDRDYLADPDQLRILPGAAEAIRRLTGAGWPVVIVTNQSGIGRGYYSQAEYDRVEARLSELLGAAGASVLATYHCPHAPDRVPPCACRKPRPGMFERAAREHHLDLSTSVYIGDRMRDLEAGVRVGGTGFLLRGPESENAPADGRIEVVEGLAEAVERLLSARCAD